MKIITIYELLGMVKDGKAPKKIKISELVYTFNDEYQMYFDEDVNELSYNIYLIKNLNHLVEILEEKKVEFKNILSLNTNICTIKRYDITDRKNKDRVACNIRNDFESIGYTVNELIENQKKIIDYLQSKKDEEII